MSTSVYELALNISTNIASLETGMAKAADVVGRTARDMSRQFDDLHSRIGFVTTALGSLAAAAGIGFGVKAFADLITGSITAQANLQDLADKVGLTASKLSSLIPAAKLSNTSIEEVGAASAKFSKNLIDVQTGTGKAAEAFKALGFNARDAARFLADPSQGLLELGQRMNTFATSGTKTAVAMELLGKSGANLLPFLKQLGEQTELTATLTDQQVLASKRLEDAFQTMKLRSEDLKNTFASGLVPELTALLKGFTDATAGPDSLGAKIKALSADGSFAIWLHEAVIGLAIFGESLVAIGKVLYAFSGSIAVVVADTKVLIAALNVKVGSGYEESVANLKKAIADRNATLEDGNERWSKAWNDNKTIVSDSLTAQLTNLQAYREAFNKSLAAQAQAVADYNAKIQVGGRTVSFPTSDANDARLRNALAGGGKPEVPFAASGGGAAKIDEFAKALETLQKQAGVASAEIAAIFSGEKFTQAQKYLAELQNTKAWATLTAGQKASVEGLAAYASDLQRTANYLREAKTITQEYSKALTDLAKASNAAFARVQLADIRAQIEDARRQYDRGVIDFETYWSRLTAAQAAGLQVEATALASNVAEQERIVADLQTAYVKFTETASQVKLPIEEQLSGAEKAATPLIAAYGKLVEAQTAFTVKQKDAAQVGMDYIEVLIAESNGHLKSIKALDNEITQRLEENEAIGLTQSQVIALNIARTEEMRLNADLSGPNGAALLKQYDDQLDRLQKLGAAVSAGENKSRLVAGWQDLFRSAADAGSKFITDFARNGSSAFKNLWADFKTWALEALAKIAAQKLIVSIAGSIGLGGTATNALAGSNPLGTLLSGGGGDIVSSLLSLVGGGGGVGDAIIGFGSALTPAATGVAALVQSTALAAGATTAFAGTLAAAVPVVGWIAAAGIAAYALFSGNKKPSEVKGQFGVSAGTSGFEDAAYTSSKFGNLGFLDAQTQQFSGEAAQVLNKIVSGALDAFAGRMSDEQQKRLTDILQKTTFTSSAGTFTTEDFLQKYGGAVLQQVVEAAFSVLDPALESVVHNFQGTADEVSKFGNTLLAIHDISQHFGEDFRAAISGALADATQETADKVAVFVAIVFNFGQVLEGLGPKLEALDSGAIIAFVDALGGAAAAAASFAYLGQNFTTASERMDRAIESLTISFTKLGVETVPQTHAQFLELLASFDLTTDAGRELYSSVLALAQQFVTVHGTADAAAGGVANLAQATKDLASATDFFQANFYTAAEQAAKKSSVEMQQLAAASAALGISIPATVEGFRALVEGIDVSTEAGAALYAALIVLAPAVYDLSGAAAAAAANVTDLATSITQNNNAADILQEQVDTFVQQAASVADQMANADVGGKLALQINLIGQRIAEIVARIAYFASVGDTRSADQLTVQLQAYESVNDRLTTSLAHFTVLSAQYGSAMAGQLVDLEKWYADQQDALKNNLPALTALDTIFQDKWAAIINGVSGAITSLDDFIKKIQQLASATGGNAGQKAGIELAFTGPKLQELQAQYAKLAPGDLLSQSLLSQINTIKAYNSGLAFQIAQFATLTAQYGVEGADQLVTLERWYADQATAMGGNADALAILGDIFDGKWKAIVDGLKTGVDGSVSELGRLRESIANYLKGLAVSDLSPLTPMEKFAQAQLAYQNDLVKAQAGDQTALGDITKFADTYLTLAREAFASSQTFSDIYSTVTGQLGDLAGSLPTGESPQVIVDKTFNSLASALPPNGETLASDAGLAALREAILEALAAHADAGTADAAVIATRIEQTREVFQEAVRSGR